MKHLITLRTLVISAIVSLVLVSNAQANTSATIMVTVNHVVPAHEVEKYVRALERVDMSLGLCFFNVKLVEFIEDYQDSTSTYYGTAILDVQEMCAKDRLEAYFSELEILQKDGVYTLFGNPIIEPLPGISGRN